jgi:hypothetical protein
MRLAWLRAASVAAVPAWLNVHWSLLPDLLAWLAVLIQGGCVVMLTCYAALEYRWSRRAAPLEPSSFVVHAVWTDWHEVRSALWYGLALVSLVPWAYVAVARAVPVPLLSSLTATVWTVLLLLGAAESVARLWPFRGPGQMIRSWLRRRHRPCLAGPERAEYCSPGPRHE